MKAAAAAAAAATAAAAAAREKAHVAQAAEKERVAAAERERVAEVWANQAAEQAAEKETREAARVAAREAARKKKEEAANEAKEAAALKAEHKALWSFAKVQRLYNVVKTHKPKGGSTQEGWELVANDMNDAADGPTKGQYTAKNAYECWLRWTNKPSPTGNPQFGDGAEIDLLFNIKSLEVDHLVAAAAPPEAELDGDDPTCSRCATVVGWGGKLFYFCNAPVMEDDGEQFYKRGSHLPRVVKRGKVLASVVAQRVVHHEGHAQEAHDGHVKALAAPERPQRNRGQLA